MWLEAVGLKMGSPLGEKPRNYGFHREKQALNCLLKMLKDATSNFLYVHLSLYACGIDVVYGLLYVMCIAPKRFHEQILSACIVLSSHPHARWVRSAQRSWNQVFSKINALAVALYSPFAMLVISLKAIRLAHNSNDAY